MPCSHPSPTANAAHSGSRAALVRASNVTNRSACLAQYRPQLDLPQKRGHVSVHVKTAVRNCLDVRDGDVISAACSKVPLWHFHGVKPSWLRCVFDLMATGISPESDYVQSGRAGCAVDARIGSSPYKREGRLAMLLDPLSIAPGIPFSHFSLPTCHLVGYARVLALWEWWEAVALRLP